VAQFLNENSETFGSPVSTYDMGMPAEFADIQALTLVALGGGGCSA